MKLVLYIFLALFSSLVYKDEHKISENSLVIICSKNHITKKGDLKIKVTYVNKGSDTIFLPTKYLELNSVQKIQFLNQEISCTIDSKMAWPNLEDCDTAFLKRAGFTMMLPNQSLDIEFVLDDLGCIGLRSLQPNKKYKYRVNLHVDDRFKGYCNKVWTGSVESSVGSIIVKK